MSHNYIATVTIQVPVAGTNKSKATCDIHQSLLKVTWPTEFGAPKIANVTLKKIDEETTAVAAK